MMELHKEGNNNRKVCQCDHVSEFQRGSNPPAISHIITATKAGGRHADRKFAADRTKVHRNQYVREIPSRFGPHIGNPGGAVRSFGAFPTGAHFVRVR
jgi:hypothetical protein